MTQSEGRAVLYRELAAICRKMGHEMPNGHSRALMLEAATTWERLAALDEQIIKPANRAEGQGSETTASRGEGTDFGWRST